MLSSSTYRKSKFINPSITTLTVFIFITLFLILPESRAQTCTGIDRTINPDNSYNNLTEDFSLPFNSTWTLAMENQRAILAALTTGANRGVASIMKNRNGYYVESAHQISDGMVEALLKKTGIGTTRKLILNTYLKNLKAKQVEYEYQIKNLDTEYQMAGIMFMLIKDGNTFVFMFQCELKDRSCFFPFFKDVMKNAFFGQSWY